MKIKTLAAMCKREGVFRLYDRVGETGEITEQWLGTYDAVYPIYGMPYLTEENIAAPFDITAKQWENISFRHDPLPNYLNFDDTDSGEVMLDPPKMTLGYGGRIVMPLISRNGLEFINADVIAPLSDAAGKLELYERRSASGGTYYAAKLGLVIMGIFMPISIIDDRFAERLETLSGKCRAALVLHERERLRNDATEEQIPLNEGGGE